eukprot:Clim_evm4s88 gene=Clim_evmTU4s88
MDTLFPLSTTTGQAVDRATKENMLHEDWGLIMDVCDTVNREAQGPQHAIKACRKRLKSQIATQQLLTLSVMEACVKNCGPRFHHALGTKDMMNDLASIAERKTQAPEEVRDRVLGLLQDWHDSLKGQPGCEMIADTYRLLRVNNVIFPQRSETAAEQRDSTVAPSLAGVAQQPTPAAAAANAAAPIAVGATAVPVAPRQQNPPRQQMNAEGRYIPDEQQFTKLRRELGIVKGNISFMNEMTAAALDSGKDRAELDFLGDLANTTKEMQTRILDLLNSVDTGNMTDELLKINDDINAAFEKYSAITTSAQTENQPSALPAGTEASGGNAAADTPAAPPRSLSEENLLFDIDDKTTEGATEGLQDLTLGSGTAAGQAPTTGAEPSTQDDFDDFEKFLNEKSG